MSYSSLNTDLGMTDEVRRNEATRILVMFQDFDALGKLSKKEHDFVDRMAQGFPVSANQLLYLRDLKTRCIE